MKLKRRPQLFQIHLIHLVHEIDRVRISHIYPHKLQLLPRHLNGFRKFGRQKGSSHIHRQSLCLHTALLLLLVQDQGPETGIRLHRQGLPVLRNQAMVVDVFSHAANAVAAHSSLGTVGIVHLHPTVRLVGRTNQDQAVPADAEAAVADQTGYLIGMVHFLLKAVHIDIIISDALHFCKFHRFPLRFDFSRFFSTSESG